MTKENRCKRIAELLLIENEFRKMEWVSPAFNISDVGYSTIDCYKEELSILLDITHPKSLFSSKNRVEG